MRVEKGTRKKMVSYVYCPLNIGGGDQYKSPFPRLPSYCYRFFLCLIFTYKWLYKRKNGVLRKLSAKQEWKGMQGVLSVITHPPPSLRELESNAKGGGFFFRHKLKNIRHAKKTFFCIVTPSLFLMKYLKIRKKG